MAGNAPLTKEEAERAQQALLELKKSFPNQSALASALGVSQQQVSNALRGRNIGFAIVRGIAKATGQTESAVLNGTAVVQAQSPRTAPVGGFEAAAVPSAALPRSPASLADRVDVIIRLFGGDENTLAARLLMPAPRVERFLADLLRHPNGPADAEVLWAVAKLANTNIPFLVTGEGTDGPPLAWVDERPSANEMEGWKQAAASFLERRDDVSTFAVELAGCMYLPDPAPHGWSVSEDLVEALVGVVSALGYPVRRGAMVPMKAPKVGGLQLPTQTTPDCVVFFVPWPLRADVGRQLRKLLSALQMKPADVYQAAGSVELVRMIDAALSDPKEGGSHLGGIAPYAALEQDWVIETFARATRLTPVDVALFVFGALPRSALRPRIERIGSWSNEDRAAIDWMQPLILQPIEVGSVAAVRAIAAAQSFLEQSPQEKREQLSARGTGRPGGGSPMRDPVTRNPYLRMSLFLSSIAVDVLRSIRVDMQSAWDAALAEDRSMANDDELMARVRYAWLAAKSRV